MQKDFYFNKKESQVKKSWTSTFSCLKLHNFYLRGNLYLVNLNSRHVKSQLNSQRRIKARKKSVERKLPIRIFDDETRLTSRELLEVTRNKETHEFKNGILAQLRGFSTHVKKPFNRHKAKRVYASEAQIEAAKYFVKLATGRFHSLKESEIRDLVPIRKNIIEKVFGKFRNHPEVESIIIYIKNLWVIYDEHLYNFEGMDRKVDYYIDLLIKNTSQEEIEKLLALGKTAHEVYCTMRKRQGANLYRIGILAKRGGPRLEIYIREAIKKLVRLHLNKFGAIMRSIGVVTEKDFFLITRRHLPFLFTEKYRRSYFRNKRASIALAMGIVLPCQPSKLDQQGSKIPIEPPD
ncbi:uncharacterized protein TNCT_97711 [Trichonephila clavata]|uniref:Uncharacterized protein n=1 Tax=Trichonephila clavata TaxID=2740835 RepID=A0A8X6F2N0_TRICU|nr:uncharacterized protein TNCT_97711 [Trichonephila clavata]